MDKQIYCIISVHTIAAPYSSGWWPRHGCCFQQTQWLVDRLHRHATLQWFLILSCDCKNMKYGTSNLQLEKYVTSNFKTMRSVKENLCCTSYVLENSCKKDLQLERTLARTELLLPSLCPRIKENLSCSAVSWVKWRHELVGVPTIFW